MASFDYDVVIIGSGFGGSHGSRLDITTGAVINPPATDALTMYEVQEIEGSIQIRA